MEEMIPIKIEIEVNGETYWYEGQLPKSRFNEGFEVKMATVTNELKCKIKERL